jgi:mannose-6-phosphate isomerase-like protein (cupin superfamily)
MDNSSGQLIVQKGWGYEKWITNTEKYCGKLLFFKKGKRCSWHYHLVKDEVFYVHSGKLELIFGFADDKKVATKLILQPGDSFHVPVGLRHQMMGLEETELFEFSTQHIEADSIRIEKGD